MANPYQLDYIDVAARIVEFREKHPTGSLQKVELQFIEFAGKPWVVYTAAAYRTPDDERPGIGTAWEPVPGATNFTRNSEVQNAETAAWGRAIVAALAADTRKSVASAEDVRNRKAEQANQSEVVDWVGRALLMDYSSLQGWYTMAVKGGAPQEDLDFITALGKEKAPGGTKTAEG
jgi:hypothetical protein